MSQMQYTPYTLPLAAVAVLSGVLAAQIWKRRDAAGARPALAMMLAMMVYAGGYALELSSTTLADIGWWVTVEYLGIVAIPPAVLGFALAYSGRGYLLTPRRILLLSVEPAIVFALQATNSAHHLMHAVVVLDDSGPFVVQRVVAYGPAFWAHTAYAYVLLCITLFVLGQMLIRSFRTYRLQASVLLLGLLAPLAADVITLLGWTPLPGVDLTPFGFGVTGVAVAWSLFGLQWLDIIPVAREAVVMGMADAVLVLDSHNRVVFLNPAGQTLLGSRAADARGQALEDVCQGWPALLQRLQGGAETGEPIEMTQAAELRRYDARISQMRDWRGRLTSRVVVLRDITASSAAEELRRRSREYLRALVENALDLIAVIDPDERLAYASPSLDHVLAYQVDQVLGKRVFDYVHPDDAATVASVLSHALQNPELVQRLELRVRHASGEWRTLQAIGRALIDEGQVVGVVVNARDVTQERADEEAQRRRSEELAAVQQTLLDISASQDLHALLTKIVDRSAHLLHAPCAGLYLCEPGCEALRLVVSQNTPRCYDGLVLKYGEGAAGVAAQTTRPLIIPDYRTWEGRAAVYEQDQPFTSVLCVPLVWHGLVTGTISVSNRPSTEPFTRQDQELLSLFASHAAIAIENARLYDAAQGELAERRRAEAALGDSEERYRSLVENMPIGVMRTTPGAEGRYLMANRAFLSMFGYDSFEQLSDVTPASLYVDPQARARLSEQVVVQGKVSDLELELKRKNGTRVWGRETLRAACDESGLVTHFDCILEDVTERKLAREELQRLKEFNEGIVLGVAEALVVEDEQGLLTFLNPAAERLLGYEPGELVGHHWRKIVAPDQIALIEDKVAQRPGGLSEQYETRLLCKDGREIAVLISARPMFRDGVFCGVLSACTDISGPKRAEQALRESEGRYRALFAEAERQATELKLLGEVRAALASELDPAVICRVVVEVIAKTFGYTQVGLYLLQGDMLWLQHQVGYDQVIESIPITAGISGRVVRTGQAVFLKDVHSDPAFLGAIEGLTSEVCIPLREGERVTGALNIESRNGAGLTEADLRLMEAVGQSLDVALSRARLHAQALHDEARYRRIFEDSPISLWEEDFSEVRQCLQELKASGVTDFSAYFANPEEFNKVFAKIKVVDVNRATLALYKASDKAELLAGIECIVHPDGYGALKEHLVRLAEGQLSWRGEVVNQTLTGETVYTDITWQVFPGYEQTWARAISSAIDITERKLAEQQRKNLEGQLRQAQKMEGMGLLAGSVAHDFNNLLTVILGNTELAMEQLTEQAGPHAELTRARGAAMRGAVLARQLLEFSRRRAPHVQRLNLNDVVSEFARLVGGLLGEQVKLQFELAPDLPPVSVDAGGLEQVLMNLALNARDAMPKGGMLRVATGVADVGAEQCRAHVGAGPGRHVCLTVADSGVGMDERVLGHLFEPFFTTKEPGKGTGLGLMVVQSIVQQHKGFVEVESAVGEGTTFRVFLPVGTLTPRPLSHEQNGRGEAFTPIPSPVSGVGEGRGRERRS